MAAGNEKIPIELCAAAENEPSGPMVSDRFDETVLRLARLVGRQIAREEFGRRHVEGATIAARNRKHRK
jgi:hypothetical protein